MTAKDAPVLVEAAVAAAILAIDPPAIGGAVLRAGPGPIRDGFLDAVRRHLPAGTPWRRLPAAIGDDRLLGGLDLSATLAAGRPVARRGLLAEADGGVIVAAMAERMEAGTAARIAAALDRHMVAVERDGFASRDRARFALIALDEGIEPDERPPAALLDRLALLIDLEGLSPRFEWPAFDPAAVVAARERLAGVAVDDATIEALCSTAAALGVESLRAPMLAVAVARASAALFGRDGVAQVDATRAARLVLGPRATRIPADPNADQADDPPPPEPPPPDDNPPPDRPDDATEPPDLSEIGKLDDVILAAAQAAIPERLLASLASAASAGAKGSGRAGALGKSALRGRPIGARRGTLRPGLRLSVVDTLRAAAPWQAIRRRDSSATDRLVEVRAEDFHIKRFKQHAETTTIFVVDASGSSALNRLAEAKGAVELLLADCYVRRDRVALIAFRGSNAELILPPTRSLVRAKRSLAGLPGGGGTPLATAIDLATLTAREAGRRGQTPIAVFLTDGRANIDRSGKADRTSAHADAMAGARILAGLGISALLVDTSPRPQPALREIAEAMHGRYLALPNSRAETLSSAVRTVTEAAS